MKSRAAVFLIFLFLNQISIAQKIKPGKWRCEIETITGKLPFHILFENNQKAYAINGAEKLAFDSLYFKGDSLHLKMELFDAEIVAKVFENKMEGVFSKKMGNLSTRKSKFTADFNQNFRFKNASNVRQHNIQGLYQTTFFSGNQKYEAIGKFNQNNQNITGTFLTTTGDYRFLEGNILKDSLKLSCFDGTHVYL